LRKQIIWGRLWKTSTHPGYLDLLQQTIHRRWSFNAQ
jgi:hypothetical protein